MIEAIVLAISLIAGTAVLAPHLEEKPKTPIMQCSIACGEGRMAQFSETHGVCKCGQREE